MTDQPAHSKNVFLRTITMVAAASAISSAHAKASRVIKDWPSAK